MTAEPIRLLDGLETSASERALLAAGRHAPIAYDAEAGALRFRATLAASAAAAGIAAGATQGAGASAGIGARSLLAKVASKIAMVLAVGAPLVGAGLFVRAQVGQGPRAMSGLSATAAPSARVTPTSPGAQGAGPKTNANGFMPSGASAPSDTTAWVAASAGVTTTGTTVPTSTATVVSRSATSGVDGHPAADRRHDGTGARHGSERAQSGTAEGAARASSSELFDPDGIMAARDVSRAVAPASAPAAAVAPSPTGVSPGAARVAQNGVPAAQPGAAATSALAADPAAAPPFAAAPMAPVTAAPSSVSTSHSASDSLAELRGIAQARALVDRDPDAALDLLEKVRREHANGYFVEERQALTVLALSRAGRTAQARQAGTAFLRAYPNGPFSDRVRAAAAR